MYSEIVFVGLSAVFAYLYTNSPESNTPSGLIYRITFMIFSLFSMLTSVFMVYSKTSYASIKSATLPWMAGLIAITSLIIGLMLIFTVFNIIIKSVNDKAEEDGKKFDDFSWGD